MLETDVAGDLVMLEYYDYAPWNYWDYLRNTVPNLDSQAPDAECNIFSEFARRIPLLKEMYLSDVPNKIPLEKLLAYREAHPEVLQGILSDLPGGGGNMHANGMYGKSPGRVTKRKAELPS